MTEALPATEMAALIVTAVTIVRGKVSSSIFSVSNEEIP
jgi:hypothetical protein